MADTFDGTKLITLEALREYRRLDKAEMEAYVSEHLDSVYSDTKSGWEAQSTLISTANKIYYYTDIKNFKVGDGVSYLSALPFVLDIDEWNKHMDYSVNDSTETLTLTKNY